MHKGIMIKENKYHCKWCDKGGQAYEAWKKMFDELRTAQADKDFARSQADNL